MNLKNNRKLWEWYLKFLATKLRPNYTEVL